MARISSARLSKRFRRPTAPLAPLTINLKMNEKMRGLWILEDIDMLVLYRNYFLIGRDGNPNWMRRAKGKVKLFLVFFWSWRMLKLTRDFLQYVWRTIEEFRLFALGLDVLIRVFENCQTCQVLRGVPLVRFGSFFLGLPIEIEAILGLSFPVINFSNRVIDLIDRNINNKSASYTLYDLLCQSC